MQGSVVQTRQGASFLILLKTECSFIENFFVHNKNLLKTECSFIENFFVHNKNLRYLSCAPAAVVSAVRFAALL